MPSQRPRYIFSRYILVCVHPFSSPLANSHSALNRNSHFCWYNWYYYSGTWNESNQIIPLHSVQHFSSLSKSLWQVTSQKFYYVIEDEFSDQTIIEENLIASRWTGRGLLCSLMMWTNLRPDISSALTLYYISL